MKRVYGSDDSILIAQLRELLQANHVECLVRNEFLMGAAGELPPNECWPELWVLHDADRDRARLMVEAFLAPCAAGDGPWTCHDCGEALDAAFSQCWNCGLERPPPEAGP